MKKQKNNFNSVNIALAGIGYWGKNLARNLYELEVLKTVYDVADEQLDKFREKYKDVKFTTDFSDILRDKTIDAVVIAAPAAKHYQLASEVLSADKHVFVEKPLALNTEEGERLVRLSEEKKKIIFVGHILHYHPALIKIKQMISEGVIGRLEYIYSNRLNLGKIRREENILWSFAPHDISAILSLTKEMPSEVVSIGSSFLHPQIPDVTMTNMRFPSGINAHIFVSWLHPFKEQRLVIVGTNGMILFEDTKDIDEKVTIYPHTIEWKNGLPVPQKAEGVRIKLSDEWIEPLRNECLAFTEAVKTGKQPLTSGKEGLNVLKVLRLCQKSIEKYNSYPSQKSISLSPNNNLPYSVHETAVVDAGAKIGGGTKIWHFSHVCKNAIIGERCILGQNVFIADHVKIGTNVKIQNNVSVYTGTIIEDDVFLGPSCVLTNVTNPRSQVKRHSLYEKTLFKRGATVGANATIVCGVTLGRYCFIAAGAVVTKDVPDYALIIGVPGKQVGWMSRHGHKLSAPDKNGIMVCPESGFRYKEVEPGKLKCLDLDENAPLPEHLSIGEKKYDEFKGGD